jgi:hypothetical protein
MPDTISRYSRFNPRFLTVLVVVCAWCCAGVCLRAAQDAATDTAGVQFAPGVVTTIAPNLHPMDVVSRHDIVELRADAKLKRSPKLLAESRTLYEMAHNTEFRRDIWCLEFSFKPLRMLAVDLPQSNGKMQRKLIWYLVYRVRNTGAGITPEQQPDGTYSTIEKQLGPQRFVPQFFLASLERDQQGKPIRKTYLDRLLPSAIEAITRREMSGGKLLNSVQMAEQVLQPETDRGVTGLWGVATWEDVDPEMDFFAIHVAGLTNAYLWEDAAEFAPGATPGTGRTFQRRMLQLNFWRPGDSLDENETEIRFGSASGKADYYGTPEGVAYEWVYR